MQRAMRIQAITLFLFVFASTAFAQLHFDVYDAPGYSVAYDVEKCEGDFCSGDLSVEVKKKGGALQRFKLKTDFPFNEKNEGREKPFRVNYSEQKVVELEDYNFDGINDLAIQNGRNGGYGGWSYNIYLYSPRSQRFEYSKGMSSLATDPYLGIFQVDRKRQVLITSQKSGCCIHVTEEYDFVRGRPRMISTELMDLADDGRVRITVEKLVNGRWRKTVRYRPAS